MILADRRFHPRHRPSEPLRPRAASFDGDTLESVEVGELLAVRDAGAYGFCMSSTYNMRPRAAEVLIADGRARLIRRRETFEDLVRTELTD